MIGDYNSCNPKLVTDKLAGGTAACMGFVPTGTKPRYVPNTILKVDIRNYIRNQAHVIAVYRKPASEPQYTEATYFAKKVDWDAIQYPEELQGFPSPCGQRLSNEFPNKSLARSTHGTKESRNLDGFLKGLFCNRPFTRGTTTVLEPICRNLQKSPASAGYPYGTMH